ncbi:ATP-binding protein [Streptosporangium sp. NPDC048047]|uniref:ATP-binding protein n=1 Tax=Streptosporangium sp. NPDC048047 TaxID=3155748 RepID=UPI003427F1A8
MKELSLAARPEAVPRARELVRGALDGWQLPQLADNAALVISELVTNAVKAISGPAGENACGLAELVPVVWMRVRRTRTRVRLEVWDGEAALPTSTPSQVSMPPDIEDIAQSGRGLALVDAYSTEWGIDDCPNGKIVWAELVVPVRERRAPGAPERQRRSREGAPRCGVAAADPPMADDELVVGRVLAVLPGSGRGAPAA